MSPGRPVRRSAGLSDAGACCSGDSWDVGDNFFLGLIVRAESSDGKNTVPPTRSSHSRHGRRTRRHRRLTWPSSFRQGRQGMPTASLHADDSVPASHSRWPLRNELDFKPGSPRKSLILSLFCVRLVRCNVIPSQHRKCEIRHRSAIRTTHSSPTIARVRSYK